VPPSHQILATPLHAGHVAAYAPVVGWPSHYVMTRGWYWLMAASGHYKIRDRTLGSHSGLLAAVSCICY